MRTTRPPSVEQLEDRCVPVTWGNPWPDAAHLSLSFAADGTAVGSIVSSLQSVLDVQASREVWQREILRAFQTWAVNANINIALVPDGGQAFGSSGRPQGDSRFGDIRIAGYDQPSDVLAIATPFESTAGTWSGDVKFNTTAPFRIGGQDGIDVFSAILHEAGHVFGLDHSPDPSSPLYEDYLGIRTGLTAGDVARLQALYGARQADKYEGMAGNNTSSTATRLSLLTNPDGSLGVAADGDIRTLQDADFFRFQAPLTLGPLVISLRTAGISLLNAKITVYDSLNRAVASASSSDPLHNDLSVTIKSPALLGTYSVKIESGTTDVFGAGSYRLEVKSLPLVEAVTNTIGAVTSAVTGLLADDLHTDDTFLTASLLPPVANQVSSQFDYAFHGRIRDSWDVDIYRATAPQAVSGQETVLSVMLWGTENGGLAPRASVYDAQQRLVSSEVLVNADGIFTVQVRNASAGATYYVKVEAADPQGANGTGNYFLGIDFSSKAVVLEQVAAGTLNAQTSSQFSILTVAQSEMMHLVLGATGGAATVQLNVVDRQGRIVASLAAVSGRDAVSLTQALPAGQYLLHFRAVTASGSAPAQVNYVLKGSRLSDPLGPRPENTGTQQSGTTSTTSSGGTQPPPPPPPANSGTTTTTSGSTTTNSGSSTTSTSPATTTSETDPDDDYYSYYDNWYDYNTSSGNPQNPQDPNSNPYPTS